MLFCLVRRPLESIVLEYVTDFVGYNFKLHFRRQCSIDHDCSILYARTRMRQSLCSVGCYRSCTHEAIVAVQLVLVDKAGCSCIFLGNKDDVEVGQLQGTQEILGVLKKILWHTLRGYNVLVFERPSGVLLCQLSKLCFALIHFGKQEVSFLCSEARGRTPHIQCIAVKTVLVVTGSFV